LLKTVTPSFSQLTLDAAIPQRGFSFARRRMSVAASPPILGRPARRLRRQVHLRRSNSRCGAQQRLRSRRGTSASDPVPVARWPPSAGGDHDGATASSDPSQARAAGDGGRGSRSHARRHHARRPRSADAAGGGRRPRQATAALSTPGGDRSGAYDPTRLSCSGERVATLRTSQPWLYPCERSCWRTCPWERGL